jgi:alkanesulfonate monooxygenase SsuD/methylene tetrahydromethanopterin reductase-like flavin-dependent oxidoreductase (luciferase family)
VPDLHLAVALDGPGWHPAVRPGPEVFTPSYWAGLARAADAARLDFVTFEDTFGPPGDGPGRPEAVLLAARLAPLTRHIGLMPVATTTHTEPFHLSTAIATLDYVSGGRAGWQARVSARPEEAALLGLRAPLGVAELFDEAADAVEVVRRLWDSWQDDAIVKDVATGRYIDRDRLHYVDFAGEFFRVKGPSIVPRPPQGQPVVAALAHGPVAYDFAVRSADVVFVTPADAEDAARIAARLSGQVKVFADLLVFLDDPGARAYERQAGLGGRSDAAVFAGRPDELADLLAEWQAAGIDGFRLRPAELPGDLTAITRLLVPILEERGLFRPHAGSLRGRLGLPRALNRYAPAGPGFSARPGLSARSVGPGAGSSTAPEADVA